MSDDPEKTYSPAFKRINPASNSDNHRGSNIPDRFVIWDNKACIISGSYGNPYKVVYDCFKEELVSDTVTDGTELGIINRGGRKDGRYLSHGAR